MKDILRKDFAILMKSLNLNKEVYDSALRTVNCDDDNGNTFSLKSHLHSDYIVMGLFNILHKDMKVLMKYDDWRDSLIENTLKMLHYQSYSGSQKNLFLCGFYQVFRDSPELGFKDKDKKELFLKIFESSTELKSKNEEQSIIFILTDLFNNINNVDKDFFKEVFSIYLEKIKTDPKYQNKINKIKEWANNEDFSFLYGKYKNIRNIFDNNNEEKTFSASIKKYNLTELAKETKTKVVNIERNFNSLNSFLEDKLKGNSNIQNFLSIDEKIIQKVIIIYDNRDSVIDAAVKIHDLFFQNINDSKKVETELMENLWNKLLLKTALTNDLSSKDERKSVRKV